MHPEIPLQDVVGVVRCRSPYKHDTISTVYDGIKFYLSVCIIPLPTRIACHIPPTGIDEYSWTKSCPIMERG